MNKHFFSLFLVLVLVGLFPTDPLQVSAQAPGIIIVISSSTIWTKADNPHVLTGPVFVSDGVTLTIDAGAIVDLNGYYLLVNGTLRATGNALDPIQLTNGEKIEFTEFSNGWNEQTGLGCIIENANICCEISSSVSLKLDGCVLTTSLAVEDSAHVSNSEISGRVDVGSSSKISNSSLGENVFVGNSSVICNSNVNGNVIGNWLNVSNNIIMGQVSVDESSVSNNIIGDGISGNSLTITGNNVTVQDHSVGSYVVGGAAIRISGGSSVISGNILDGGGGRFDMGFRGSGTIGTIDVGSSSAVISDNVIDGAGIYLIRDCNSLIIRNNTINSGIFCKLITWEGTRAIYNVNSFEISENQITGTIDVSANYLSVLNNLLVGSSGTGIEFSVSGTEVTSISNNIITGFFRGISGNNPNGVIIEKNLITNNTQGIWCTENHVVIQNNTITDNSIGIFEGSSSTIIRYNNLENNTENSISLESTSEDIDASNNWWGTTDTKAINLTIRDYKYDFDLGKVNFVPFLNEFNPQAPSTDLLHTIPSDIPEFSPSLVLPLLFVATLTVVVIQKKITGEKNENDK